jgi:prevent-host-death family protein
MSHDGGRGIRCFRLIDQKRRPDMPKSISLANAKATLSERIREVEAGQRILITRHGRAVAALVQPSSS